MLLFFHRIYELLLNGGTPYERGVEVDPSISRRGVVSSKHYISEMIPQMLYLLYSMQCSAKAAFVLCVPILHES